MEGVIYISGLSLLRHPPHNRRGSSLCTLTEAFDSKGSAALTEQGCSYQAHAYHYSPFSRH